MKKLVCITLFLFCSLTFAQTSSINISKTLNFSFSDEIVMSTLFDDEPGVRERTFGSNNLGLSYLEFSFDEFQEFWLLIESSTEIEYFSRKTGEFETNQTKASVVISEDGILDFYDKIREMYSNRKTSYVTSSSEFNWGTVYYEQINGLLYITINNSLIPDGLFSNSLMGGYKNLSSIYFTLSAEQTKKIIKFLKKTKHPF